MTIVLRDVSQQVAVRQEREVRRALENANRERTFFLSRMSHELRTPLNARRSNSSPTLRPMEPAHT